MNKFQMNRRDVLGLGISVIGASGWAQTSGRPVSVIVPQPAGNPTDALARKFQPLLQRELGQTVVVENLPGAGGSIGVNKVFANENDGRSLLIASQTEPILTPLALAGVRYKPEDLRCVAFFGRAPYVLVGRPGLAAKSLADLTALAKSSTVQPLSFGHIGEGSMIHLLGEQWSRQGRFRLLQIPYKGVPPVLQDVMGGQIDLTFMPLGGSTINLIESGKVQAYGVTASVPNSKLPKVAPLAQLDPALADFIYGTWAAVFVKRTTPQATVNRLHTAFAVAMVDAELQAYLSANGIDRGEPLSLAQLDQFYQTEIKLYQDMARKIGITPQ